MEGIWGEDMVYMRQYVLWSYLSETSDFQNDPLLCRAAPQHSNFEFKFLKGYHKPLPLVYIRCRLLQACVLYYTLTIFFPKYFCWHNWLLYSYISLNLKQTNKNRFPKSSGFSQYQSTVKSLGEYQSTSSPISLSFRQPLALSIFTCHNKCFP